MPYLLVPLQILPIGIGVGIPLAVLVLLAGNFILKQHHAHSIGGGWCTPAH